VTLRSRFILLVALSSLAPGAAHAGGFNVARYAGEHGHAASDSVTSIYFNPAGLALGTGWRIYGEGLVAFRHVSYFRPELAIGNVLDPGDTGAGTPADALDTNSGTATLNNVLVSPFLGAATDFGVPNLGVGLAFYAPFGGQAKWDKNDAFEGNTQYPGAVDGPGRWSTIEGELRSLYLSAAGAYRLPGPRLSFGLGVNFIRSNIDTVRARTAAGTDDIVTDTGDIVEGRSYIDVDGVAVSASAGVIWEPMEAMWIGLSYQSQPGFGNHTQSGQLVQKLGLTGVDETPIRLEQELPDVWRIAWRHRPVSNVEVRVAGDYQRWSVFKNQCLLDGTLPKSQNNCDLDSEGAATPDAEGIIVNIPRRWNDTFGVRAGGSYWFTPDLEVNGGLNYDSSAVPDETIDISLLDQNKLIALAGVRWGVLPQQLILDLTLNNVFYFKRTVDPRARDADDGQIGPLPPSSVPDGGGTYKQNVFYVQLGAEYMF
jgi:long-chain fatty acid transport protein